MTWAIRRKDGQFWCGYSSPDGKRWSPSDRYAVRYDDQDRSTFPAGECEEWVETAPLPAPTAIDPVISERIAEMLREADCVDPELTIRVSCNGFSKLLFEVSNLRGERDELAATNAKLLEQKSIDDEAGLLTGLGPDERRVLAVLANRLRGGAKAYGELDLANDQRDWEKERGEEVADLLVYSAFAELKRLAREGKA